MKGKTKAPDAPDPKASDSGAPLYEFRKNAIEVVRATISTFHGHQLADIRVYFQAEDGTWPTKKGLAIGLDLLPELRAAVEALERAASAKGLAA